MKKDMADIIDVIKKSREEIGEKRFNDLAQEVDNELKEKLGKEKWEVYLAANGNQSSEDKLIEKIGEEKYKSLLNEIVKTLNSELGN